MAAGGVTPKHRSTRRRTGSGFRVLDADYQASPLDIPPLIARPDGEEWHPYTLEKWEVVMNSPMRTEYVESDIKGLLELAVIWDEFFKCTSPAMLIRFSAEIRQQEMRFGLSPIDRRRLQWEIQRGEQAAQVTKHIRRLGEEPQAAEVEQIDPRELLAG